MLDRETYDAEQLDAIFLNSGQEGLELEPGQHDDFVSTPGAGVGDDDKAIDVAERQEADFDLCADAKLVTAGGFEGGVLQDVGDDISMRYHDGFLDGED